MNKPIDEDALLTLEDAARLFPEGANVTADTLKRRIRKGQLVAYKVGRPYLTTWRDVKAMLAASTAERTERRPMPRAPTVPDMAIANAALEAACANLGSKKKGK